MFGREAKKDREKLERDGVRASATVLEISGGHIDVEGPQRSLMEQFAPGGPDFSAFQAAAAVAQQPAGEDPVDKLEKLADLRDRGVLSEEEFAAQKARILGES